MVVPRNNKWKFVSSAYNSEVENGKNDNSIAEQNNPDEIAAANKISKRAFGNGNAKNLFDEMRTLFARIEQKQIEQAKVWRQQPKVFEKVQEKKTKILRPKLCDEKEKIEKARLAGSIHGMDDDKLGKEDDWNLINGNEWKQFKSSVENIVQRLAKQKNNINKNINCDKNAKESSKINKIISQSFIPPPNQQSICGSPDEKTAENGQNLNQMNTSWFGNGCMQLKWNYFPSVKPKQLSPKRNTARIGNGSMQLNWNFFPSVKPKCNKEQRGVWHPPKSFRIFVNFAKQLVNDCKKNTGMESANVQGIFACGTAFRSPSKYCARFYLVAFRIFTDFAKHDGPMIAKRTLEWNQPRCKEISRVEPLSEGEGM